ncbi:MAG: acyltransferase family protein [Anaerolineales bacterium]
MTTSIPNPQSRNQSVDTIRLLAALCVIILHLEYPALPSNIVIAARLLSRWAIPFFFIVSGYYFAVQNKGQEKLKIQPMMERLIWIFLLWSIIYAPVVFAQHDLKTMVQRFFSPTFLYSGDFLHLWFISSLVFGYIFIAFCHEFNIKSILPFFSIVFIGIALISGPYPLIKFGLPLNFDFARHWLSVPFLAVGFYFYKKGFPNAWVSAILIVAGAGLQMVEARFIYRQFGLSAYDHEFLIGTIPFAIGMAGLALNNLKWLQIPILSTWGREYSLGIYLFHMLMIFIVSIGLLPLFSRMMAPSLLQLLIPFFILALCILLLEGLFRWMPGLVRFLFGKQVS